MDNDEITRLRLANQCISQPSPMRPEGLVSYLGAVQAQAYRDALWAVGLRCKKATQSDVEDAIAERKIIRTWAMRGTWHLVPPKEVKWMLSLYHEDASIPSRQRKNGLTRPLLKKGMELVSDAFKHERQLTYKDLGRVLSDSGIPEFRKIDVQRHIIRRSGRKGIICFSEHVSGRPAFALFKSPVPKPPNRDAVLAKLARTYFGSHGPATLKDFAWWAGIGLGDAESGLDAISSRMKEDTSTGDTYWMPKKNPSANQAKRTTYLLPAFDEYLVAYKNRASIIEPKYATKVINGSNGTFLPALVSEGRVIGTWRRKEEKNRVTIALSPFTKLNKEQNEGIKEAADSYGRFIEKSVTLK